MIKKSLLLLFIITSIAFADNPTPSPSPDVLKQAAAKIITQATQTAGDAKDFVLAQLPDVVRQLLIWKFVQSLVEFLISVALLIVAITILRRGFRDEVYKDDKTEKYDFHPQHGFPRFILWIVSIGGTIVFGIAVIIDLANPTWLQIWLAPKVYLIEYAKDFIK